MTNTYSPERIVAYFENSGYKTSSVFKDSKSKMSFYDKDGYKYSLSYNSLRKSIVSGNLPSKFHKSNIFTIENISLWIKVENKGISLFEKNVFIGSYEKNLVFSCDECSHKFKTSWNLIQQGKTCPRCNVKNAGLKRRLSLEDVELVFNNSTVRPLDINQYDTMDGYMDVECRFCGHSWEITFGNVKIGNGCPKCRMSKGEIRVAESLKSNKIEYQIQKTFDGCFYNKKLKFDFFIESKNIAIEYNGKQHYEIVNYSSSKDRNIKEFELVKIRDRIKKEYCFLNNIELITISYKQFNEIDSIIKKINGGN